MVDWYVKTVVSELSKWKEIMKKSAHVTVINKKVSSTVVSVNIFPLSTECYETLELKRQVQMEANYQRERELALLNATSKVSDSLVRVYFLDGSFKTVFYDSSVTAADIIAKICFSVKIALFEVHRDIKNPNEYCLVPENECIGDITVRWERNGADNAKFVVPIYDVNSALRGKVGYLFVASILMQDSVLLACY